MASGIPAIRNSMVAGVYLIRNVINCKQYIGSSQQLMFRFGHHLKVLREGTHRNKSLQRDWVSFGPDAFEFRVLLICSEKHLLLYEQLCLNGMANEYNNGKIAGSPRGVTWTPEQRAAWSARRKNTPPSPKQIAQTNLLAEMARARKGKPRDWSFNAEQRERIAAALRGRKQSPELIEKRASKTRGVPKSEEHRRKLSEAAFRRWAKDRGDN